MHTHEDIYVSDETIDLSLSSGDSFPVRLQEATLETENNKIVQLKLELKIDRSTYNIVDQQHAFNLTPEARKESSFAVFEEDTPIEIEMFLGKDFVETAAELTGTAKDFIAKLKELDGSHELKQSSSWFATVIKQEIDLPPDQGGNLKMGYSTIWADQAKESKLDGRSDLYKFVFDFFNQNTKGCTSDPKSETFQFGFAFNKKLYNAMMSVRSEFNQLVLYIYSPFVVNSNNIGKAAGLIAGINWDLPVGNFELNTQTGDVRYKTYHEIGNTGLDSKELKLLFEANIYTLDKYIEQIEALT